MNTSSQALSSRSSAFAVLPWHATAERMLRACAMVWLVGKPGVGKSTFVHHWALQRTGAPPSCLQGSPKTDELSFWGRYTLVGGNTQFVDGPLAAAIKAGGVFVLEDVGAVPFAALSTLLPLREPGRVRNPVSQEVLVVPPQFRVLLTSNPDNYKCRTNRVVLEALNDGALVVQVPDFGEAGIRSLLEANFPRARRANVQFAVRAWQRYSKPTARQGEDAPMRLSYRAAHHLVQLLEDGVLRDEAVQAAMVDKFHLDQELHGSVQLKRSIGEDTEVDDSDREAGEAS